MPGLPEKSAVSETCVIAGGCLALNAASSSPSARGPAHQSKCCHTQGELQQIFSHIDADVSIMRGYGFAMDVFHHHQA